LLFYFLLANLTLAVGHLLPIPGLDGARIVGVFLPPRAAEVYRNADQYLPLILLVVFFLLANPLLTVVRDLARGLCRVLAGFAC
jgi:Zn-dependent protease